MRAAVLLFLIAGCASCTEEAIKKNRPGAGATKQPLHANGQDLNSNKEESNLTWHDVSAESRKIEAALDTVIDRIGFKNRQDLEQHPTEAQSYERIYSAPLLDPTREKELFDILRRASEHYRDEDITRSRFEISIQGPPYEVFPESDIDFIWVVTLGNSDDDDVPHTKERLSFLRITHAIAITEEHQKNGY